MQVGYNASFQTRYANRFLHSRNMFALVIRYFEGVQGEKTKQGELFGIKNIFTLHEDTLATKQAVSFSVLVTIVRHLSSLSGRAGHSLRLQLGSGEYGC